MDYDSGYSVMMMWSDNKGTCQHCSMFGGTFIALIRPSSAKIERAFWHLRGTIANSRRLALGNTTEASLLLKHNPNRRFDLVTT